MYDFLYFYIVFPKGTDVRVKSSKLINTYLILGIDTLCHYITFCLLEIFPNLT